jgi:UDPglucose--hexose-1-phosphate uridylyltransferase
MNNEGTRRLLEEQSHRRRNALTGEWVLVSPHRTLRPWLGQQAVPDVAARAAYDPSCYLCPGNARADGARNPRYVGSFVFPNDFPALSAAGAAMPQEHPLFAAEGVTGECRVICYSPRHDLSLGDLPVEEVVAVVRTWREQFRELDARADLAYLLIFENRGEMMGASNPHPHGQLWATSVLPNEIVMESGCQSAYLRDRGRALLTDYLQAELAAGTRVVRSNPHWVAMVPFWAEWPFELLVLPTRPVSGFEDITAEEEKSLAALLSGVVATYDRMFGVAFPYSMGWHPRPSDGSRHAEWVLHGHFYPPLLRSASVRKFQVGFELLAMPQRDLTPEVAAEKLRALSNG